MSTTTETKIEWATWTFNPWRGCQHATLSDGAAHPGCEHCYAEAMAKRNPGTLGQWGEAGTRVVAAESYWRQPLKWNAAAKADGIRKRVFCASLADVFEDWRGPMRSTSGTDLLTCHGCGKIADHYDCGGSDKKCGRVPRATTMNDVRRRLFALIDATPALDWLLLTKRPENVLAMWPFKPPGAPNVWLGASVSDQETADRNAPHLLRCAGLARVLFLSAEPLLGPINIQRYLGDAPEEFQKTHTPRGIDWVIVGGESGHHARPCNIDWIKSLRDQCRAAGVPCFIKQLGAVPFYPHPGIEWKEYSFVYDDTLELKDKKGGDWTEWTHDLRVRQLPEAAP